MVSVSEVHAFALIATYPTLRQALDRGHPAAAGWLALCAVASAFNGEGQNAIALMHRALKHVGPTSKERAYLSDMLYTCVSGTGDFESSGRIMEAIHSPPTSLLPAIRAAEATIHAVRGGHVTSRSLSRKAILGARKLDAPNSLAHVLSRCSLAAYYRGDYVDARELALESAHLFECNAGYVSAARCLSITAAIAHDWNGDGALARAHYCRMTAVAEKAGHAGLVRLSIVARFNLAAEMFDTAEYASLRILLTSRPLAQQHQENFALTIADALGSGWSGNFTGADAALAGHLTLPGVSQSQRALIEALRSLIEASRWDLDAARLRCRAALLSTAKHPAYEPLHERRYRDIARILSASTCFIIGDRVRGERALSARFDPDRRYLELVSAPQLDISRSPEIFRGYAEFIRVAAAHALAARPSHRLTPAEFVVLRALPGGATLAELARELEKSKNTLARQVESIYGKLDARNRAQAIENARRLGILG